MSDIGIGRLIDQERGRDAIHIAVAPVTAAYPLTVGSHVAILGDGLAGYGPGPIGIVDPYLKEGPKAGEKFYLFLYPGSITSLRHEWVHPAFKEVPKPETPDKAASEKWLREYANRVNPYYEGDKAYETLMDDLRGSHSITYHGIDMHGRSELIDESDLQYHASIVLGKQVNFDHFEYFSCSC